MKRLFTGVLLAAVFTLGMVFPVPASAAGAALHPRYTVAAHKRNSHDLSFREHHPIRLRARGNGGTDLNLYVYDHHDNLVAHDDDDAADNCMCVFTPEEGETYRIVVENKGHRSNSYELYYEMAE